MRAVLEAIYEPQQGDWEQTHGGAVCFSMYNTDMNSYKAKNSPHGGPGTGWDTKVPDLVAERLGLERIGWIYTGLPRDELLNAQEVYEIAKLQTIYSSTEHYSGYRLSTFLSVTVL